MLLELKQSYKNLSRHLYSKKMDKHILFERENDCANILKQQTTKNLQGKL